MADPDELVPNPEGCTRFEPNAFKKEKCKTCGRSWQEHKGVIEQKYIDQFLGAKRKAAEDKAKGEAEAKAKAAAKKQAQKKAEQAVEDSWFMDEPGSQGGASSRPLDDDDEDDDMGFKMFTAADFKSGQASSEPTVNKPLKVTNLIDFTECDVAEEGDAALGMSFDGGSRGTDKGGSVGSTACSSSSAGLGAAQLDYGISPAMDVSQLHNEIDYLHQMLANANEEKNIQVAIVMDEVSDKQKIIDELREQVKDLEARAASSSQEAVAQEPTEAELASAKELETLRVDVKRLRSELDAAEAASESNRQAASAAIAHAREVSAKAQAAQADQGSAVEDEKSALKFAKALRGLRLFAEKQVAIVRSVKQRGAG